MIKDQFKILIEDFFILFGTCYFSEMSKEIINEKVDKVRIAPMLKKSLNKIWRSCILAQSHNMSQ